MRISFPPPSPDEIRRLEAAAEGRPRLYRLQLTLLVLAGDAALTCVRVFPLAAPIVLGALLANNTIIDILAAFAVVLLTWLTRPGHRDSGEGIERKDAPNLHAVLDDLRTKLDVGPRMEVRLDDEANAGAREARGLFGIIGNRRVLTLGVPLLALLGKDEVRAVIAHEFGHFSRRHGWLGHWLYQAHLGWLSHAEQIDGESSILDRAGASFAEIFAPALNRRAMVWSRRCEYEADADAAGAVGRGHLVSALARLDAFGEWSNNELPRIEGEWQHTEPTPPDNYLERVIDAFESRSLDLVTASGANEGSRPADWLDTHPTLAARATALGLQPSIAPRENPAGSVLLGGFWPTVAAEYNDRWRKAKTVEWAAAYTRYRLIEAPLLAADPEAVAGWPTARRFEHARVLRRFEPKRGLAELAVLHAEATEDRNVAFAYAAARLAEGDGSAVEAMRLIAKEDASWCMPAYARLIRYLERTGDRAAAHRWARLLESAGESEMRAYELVCSGLVSVGPSPTTRPAPLIEVLRAALAADPAVARAWLAESNAPLTMAGKTPGATLRADALILIIDPFDAMQRPYDVDAIKARHQQVLSGLIEPNALAVVISFYSTEPLPSALHDALEQFPRSCVHVR
ncbi:Zn-dependent protease with chaperone function [Bradyrhizobium sp. YR681]|uniref:M48 family metalloprotease n=1 Tax=Bradyrhizobium sp. YR681 TaxID=1144344 RepID=UPI00026FBA1C|nr:M48 family metallopeptidase [Bradyrhizobium sp. YR681]EJN08856.1 Zn-dependent protease with chaperone function [Bradyrhizobium sp. YR681]